MAFMEPEYYDGEMYYCMDDDSGEDGPFIPADHFMPSECPQSFGKVSGWFTRLNARGYTDATDWDGPFTDENEARQHVFDHWEVDPDNGDAIDDVEGEWALIDSISGRRQWQPVETSEEKRGWQPIDPVTVKSSSAGKDSQAMMPKRWPASQHSAPDAGEKKRQTDFFFPKRTLPPGHKGGAGFMGLRVRGGGKLLRLKSWGRD
jgi:hypothetical protein